MSGRRNPPLPRGRPLWGIADTRGRVVALVLLGSLLLAGAFVLFVAWVVLSTLAAYLALAVLVRRRYGVDRERIRWVLYGVLIADAVVLALLLLLYQSGTDFQIQPPPAATAMAGEL